MQPDWDRYRHDFPDRYWRQGAFDETLRSFVAQRQVAHCLDIGGGATGTEVLGEFAFDTHLLDPYVKEAPAWMKGRQQWEAPHATFDLAVARGSINYLSIEQLQTIADFLKKGGALIANTFLTVPQTQWRERGVTNGKGEAGIERVRCVDGVVHHHLVFPSTSIEHTFFFYSEDQFSRLFPGVRFLQHGPNSHTLFWEK